MCINKDIKELIPPYLRQELDQHEHERVKKHVESCADCRADLALLGIMSDESVPDPGEAYWAEMPGRVFRAVQAQKKRKWPFEPSWFTDRLTLPRWAIAAVAGGLILVISWLVVHPWQKSPAATVSQGYELAPEIMDLDAVPLSGLDHDQIDTVSTWAGSELALIAHEAAPVMNASDTDIDEELTELNTKEAERLSSMLDQWEQEG